MKVSWCAVVQVPRLARLHVLYFNAIAYIYVSVGSKIIINIWSKCFFIYCSCYSCCASLDNLTICPYLNEMNRFVVVNL